MKRTVGKTRHSGTSMHPRAKVWLEVDGRYVFGHGLAEILLAIDSCGSIKEASGRLGKSYRYVWQRVKEAEEALQSPLVDAHVGGAGTHRSRLTSEARQLLTTFMRLRTKVLALVEREFAARFSR
jgi:molybdate transport system regulatory protein